MQVLFSWRSSRDSFAFSASQKIVVSMSSSCIDQAAPGSLDLIIRIPPHHQKKTPPERVVSFLCCLDTIDISTILPYCDHDRFLPTPVPGAFRKRWILPRPKKVSPGHFFTPAAPGPAFRIPLHHQQKGSTPKGWILFVGGAAGIRTLATLSRPTRFRVTPLRPA